jgi:hypothetical protein
VCQEGSPEASLRSPDTGKGAGTVEVCSDFGSWWRRSFEFRYMYPICGGSGLRQDPKDDGDVAWEGATEQLRCRGGGRRL